MPDLLVQWQHRSLPIKMSWVPFLRLLYDFSQLQNYSTVFTDWMFLCLSVPCPCSVLCCLRKNSCTLLTTSQRTHSNYVHRNFSTTGNYPISL